MRAPDTHTTSSPPPFPYFALLTVALAVFLSVTIEMLPTGLLPDMSAELGVTESLIGLTVSVFAFTVVLSSAPLAHVTRRVDRHLLVVIVLLVLVLSTALTAIAPSYEILVASRILGGLAHGLFWAVVGAYSAYLVPKEQIGRAVSISLGGGSLAFVFGVPLGTALGHAVGWRASFAILAGLSLVGTFFVWKFLPAVKAGADSPMVSTSTGGIAILTDSSHAPRREQSILAVVFVCLITAVTMIGQYTIYTYIAPFLIREVGLDPAAISPALFAYGTAGVVSLIIVGVWFGKRPRLGLMVSIIGVLGSIVVLAVWPSVVTVSMIAFILWGLSMGMLPPLLQTRLLHAAPARIRDTSSAFYTTAFNTGIGGGALVGALALENIGLRALPLIYIGLLLLAIVLVIGSDAILRRQPKRRVVEH
ncbi:MAG: transporter [Homoserinimonas sp.]|nr:transporter [Homoserinimonas sp.]